ncbi:MAG: hypothetical protein P1T08_10800 [Acidimicrobiia bacterium]|nr:hypothetical protein [Acidimicrobiia bacterium]
MTDPSLSRSAADNAQTGQRPSVQVGPLDIVTTLRRGWLQFLLLALIVISAVNFVAWIVEPDEPLYHAEALVVASQLEIRVESFPRTAVAIFNGGTVAALAAERAGTGILPADLIPDIVTAEPLENTWVVGIEALHPDPELAALYANAAGQALAEELNRVGPGFGEFALQIEATVPTTPLAGPRLLIIVLSVVAGLASAIGMATLITFYVKGLQPDPSARPVSVVRTHADSAHSVGATGDQWETWDEDGSAYRRTAGGDGQGRRLAVAPTDGRDQDEQSDLVGDQPLVVFMDEMQRSAPVRSLISSHEAASEVVESINGIGPIFGARLATAGITTLKDLANADPRWLAGAIDVRRQVVVDWIEQAVDLTAPSDLLGEEG